MSSIPDEIYHDIFLKLPAKSLLACKFVCRNWYELITSFDFLKTHTILEKNQILMLESFRWSISPRKTCPLFSMDYDSLASSPIVKDDRDEMDYPFKSLNYDVHEFLGSCDGIICLWLRDYVAGGEMDIFCLWNPTTREYKKLTNPPNAVSLQPTCYIYGFGYGQDDYKLAIGSKPQYGCKPLVQVCSSASNSWTRQKSIPYAFDTERNSGVLVYGNLHWLVTTTTQYKTFILSLDISYERFKEIQPPKEIMENNKKPAYLLGVLEGCLCVLGGSSFNKNGQLELWEMLNYGFQESWTRRYIITRESSIFGNPLYARMMCNFENGKILFIFRNHLVLYDPEDGSATELSLFHNTRYVLKYFGSLVSLKSGTYVGEEGRKEEI